MPVKRVEIHHILKLRDRFADKPATANNVLRTLSAVLSWGVPRKFLDANPCLGMRGIKLKGGKPYDPWPWAMIELLREVAPERLWYVAAMALVCGLRDQAQIARPADHRLNRNPPLWL